MTATFERLKTILLRDYKLAPETLTPDAPLDALGIDSLGTVELLWNVEDEFKIKLPAEPVNLPTLGDVVRYIDTLMAPPTDAAAPAAAAAETPLRAS